MFRFLHSADWQLGARFTQFGARGGRLRETRLATLRRALALARERLVDAFLIAGDLFEDNHVDDALVAQVLELFREFPSVPVFILPGNHDPFTGPDAVWQRKAFLTAPDNVRVLREPGTVEAGGATLIASPLQQKLSTVDPSLRLAELAAAVPATGIKIGITHGALAIEGKHQPNDFPIALDAASRAGLDYLAIGHWHNWLADADNGRIVMPGTPEPDRFGNERSGCVALVEIEAPGQRPRVEPIPVHSLAWRSLTLDFLALESSRASLESALAELRPAAANVVLRVTLAGATSPRALADTRAWVESQLGDFFVAQIHDATRIELSPAERADLQARHPLLAQVLADIDRLEALATGATPAPANASASANPNLASATASGSSPLTLAEAQALLGVSKIELASLTPGFFSHLRQQLFQALQEVAS